MAIQTLTLANTYFEWLTTTNQIITNLNLDVSNAAFTQANLAPIAANSYAREVGTAGNNYLQTVATAGNNYTREVGLASNTYVIGIGTAGNNYTQTANNFAVAYTQTVGTVGNTYAREVGTAGNNYTNTVGTAGNNYLQTVAAAGNSYTRTVGAASNTQATAALTVAQGAFGQANTARTLANTSLQNNTTTLITTGYTFTSFNAGVYGTATWTPDAANGNYQYLTANGVITVTVPTTDCSIDVLITNGIAANTKQFSGSYTISSSVGDEFTNTNGNKFLVSIRRINSISTYLVKALQ